MAFLLLGCPQKNNKQIQMIGLKIRPWPRAICVTRAEATLLQQTLAISIGVFLDICQIKPETSMDNER